MEAKKVKYLFCPQNKPSTEVSKQWQFYMIYEEACLNPLFQISTLVTLILDSILEVA